MTPFDYLRIAVASVTWACAGKLVAEAGVQIAYALRWGID